MTGEELIEALTILKEQALKSNNDTAVINVNVDSFTFVIESAIKALEQEQTTKNDLGDEYISRSDLMAILSDYYDTTIEYRSMLKEIAALPTVTPQEPKWIPVSERLPDNSGNYLVSVIDGSGEDDDYEAVDVAWFAHKKDYNFKESKWQELGVDETIIAWMPLPEPYKADRSEE